MKTIIIETYAGPGSGKTVLAAQMFVEFKKQGKSVELASEWVKGWAWEGRKPQGSEDGLYIFAKQVKQESRLYGKVDYIITDSPLGLCPVYEALYNPKSYLIRNAYTNLMHDQYREDKVERVKIHLRRKHAYVNAGRFEDEETAKAIDSLCLEMNYGQVVDGLEEAVALFKGKGYL